MNTTIEKIARRMLLTLLMLSFMATMLMPMAEGRLSSSSPKISTTNSSSELIFSTFLGGSEDDEGYSIAVDSDGNCYVTGWTSSDDFPTKNAFNSTYGSNVDAFISKFDANGSLLWSTYLGGSEDEGGSSIAVDTYGNCYVTGSTRSDDFPTKNAFNSTYGGNYDAFISKFDANGTLLWSTYLGGSNNDYGRGIAVDSDGNCYVIGNTESSNFPTKNAYNDMYSNNGDAFISKFNTNGALLWSTYLGGDNIDYGKSIAVDTYENCYVTGSTSSGDFPIKDAFNSTYGGHYDAFISKFNANGTLLWSTYLGGSETDSGNSITVTDDGNCFVTGSTESSNFPIKDAFNSTYGDNGDVFISKFHTNGALLWSTYLGGSEWDVGLGITVAIDGSCYVTGTTYSGNFPIKEAFNSTYSDNGDAFISKFDTNGTLLWSTYLGGSETDIGYSIAVDSDGNCYVTGYTSSDDFPTKNAYDDTKNGYDDVFLSKLFFEPDTTGPTITAVNYPTNPANNETIDISCEVSDPSGVQTVTLYYRINGSSWSNVAMQHLTDDSYEATIGPFNANSTIQFYIEAIDDSPNHNSAIDNNGGLYYSFTVVSASPPTSTTTSAASAAVLLPLVTTFSLFVLLKRKKK